jgi:hypothetical protein
LTEHHVWCESMATWGKIEAKEPRQQKDFHHSSYARAVADSICTWLVEARNCNEVFADITDPFF